MALIALVSAQEKARKELALSVQELGHRVVEAPGLREGLELLNGERPQLFLFVEPEGERTAENLLGELEREAPLLPVVVALGRRSAVRAMELLKAGAYEVIAPPWTPEGVRATLSKALRFKGTAFEFVRQPDPLRRRVWVLAALVVLGAVLAYGGLERRHRRFAAAAPAALSWALPDSHPAGLAYRGGQFWVTDWFSQSVYRLDSADLRVLRAQSFPKEIPGALAFAGDALWVAAAPRALVKHMLDERLSVLQRFPDAAPQSVGLAYDGLYLWTCDSKTGMLHKRILDDTLSVVASFRYPGASPAALAFDGKALWSLDAGNKELLRHDIDRPSSITARVPLAEYRSGQWKPTGLAYDGRRFWTVAERIPKGEGPARIFMHAPAPL